MSSDDDRHGFLWLKLQDLNACIHTLDSAIDGTSEFVGALNDHLITIAGSDFCIMNMAVGGTIHTLVLLIVPKWNAIERVGDATILLVPHPICHAAVRTV